MSITFDSPSPWDVLDLDPDVVLASLRQRFPEIVAIWRGEWTGSWWALKGGKLVEHSTPSALSAALEDRPTAPSVQAAALPAAPRSIVAAAPLTQEASAQPRPSLLRRITRCRGLRWMFDQGPAS